MERPIKEVLLPVSGVNVEIYTYYLRGEKKQIEAIMLESAKFVSDEKGKPKLDSVDASYRTKMEDKAVLLAVKKLTGKDGKELEKTVAVLDGLPDDDYELLQQSLPEGKKEAEQVKKK